MVASLWAPIIFKDFYNTGEPLTKELAINVFLRERSDFFLDILRTIMGWVGAWRTADIVKHLKPKTGDAFEELLLKRKEFAYEMSSLWQSWGIDALVQPSYQTCAF